jgi:hypothetical protein
VKWAAQPEKDDYPAAERYLSLLFEPSAASEYVRRLKKAGVAQYKASDLFRASGLEFTSSQVKAQRKKITAGKKLSPLLLVRDTKRGRVVIADGFHRMCAVYSLDDEASIPCKLA